MSKGQRIILAIALWLAAIAAAAMFDERVAQVMRDSGVADYIRARRKLEQVLKIPGEFYFTVIVAAIVALKHPLKWRAGGFVLLGTVVTALNVPIKSTVGRLRPFLPGSDGDLRPFEFKPFPEGFLGMFYAKNLCFPSGHTALAFATATAVAMLWPQARWRWWAFLPPALVAAERVAENAHWLSDVVAAAALGVGGVYLVRWIVTRFFNVDERHPIPVSGDPLLQRTGERSDASPTR